MKLKKPIILVLSGGSIKGISFLGVIKYLEEKNIMKDFKVYAGSSVGSMILYLLNIGYTSEDLISVLLNIDISNSKDITTDSILEYFKKFGFDTGKNMMKILTIFTKRKKIKTNITFSELYKLTKKKLIITGTNVSKQIPVYFDYQSYPNMSVIEAVRISISIPLIFTSYVFNQDLYVDGSLMDNYPIGIFDNKEEILGLYIENVVNPKINSIDQFIYSLINCLMKREIYFYKKKNKHITVNIKVGTNYSMFDIDIKQKKHLYTIGYREMNNYYNQYFSRFK